MLPIWTLPTTPCGESPCRVVSCHVMLCHVSCRNGCCSWPNAADLNPANYSVWWVPLSCRVMSCHVVPCVVSERVLQLTKCCRPEPCQLLHVVGPPVMSCRAGQLFSPYGADSSLIRWITEIWKDPPCNLHYRRIHVLLYSKNGNIGVVIYTLSSAHWQQASKLTSHHATSI